MAEQTAASVVICPGCGTKNRVPAVAAGLPRCPQCKASLPWVADADEDTFAALVDAAVIPVLVDLWAPWCGPCRMVSPALERLAGELAGRVKLVKVNVDDAPGLARRFSAQSIPTLVVVHGGRLIARQVGAASEGALRTWQETALAKTG